MKGHASTITSVLFNPFQNLLVSGSSDKTIKLWSIIHFKLIKTLFSHRDIVESVAISA